MSVPAPLIETQADQLSIRRKKWGRGFAYFQADGDKISDAATLKRLRDLAIPPMWQEVEICNQARGHIQATGRDSKGRKQYIYHPEWQRQRQIEKFERLREFAKLLPEMRRLCHQHLQDPPSSQAWVLSLMLLVLDETGIRIGNRQYHDRNETVGLTSMRRKHCEIKEGHALFSYQGKHGKAREVELDDEELIRHIRTAAEQPGYELFRYQTGYRQWELVDSEDVNAFIHRHMGEAYSAKDFRTWVAGRLAVEYFPEAQNQHRRHPRRKFSNVLIDLVSRDLGNTRTVCRDYYLDPHLLKRIEQGALPPLPPQEPQAPAWTHTPSELLLLQLMEKEKIMAKASLKTAQ